MRPKADITAGTLHPPLPCRKETGKRRVKSARGMQGTSRGRMAAGAGSIRTDRSDITEEYGVADKW